jgi:hypothetical protein
MDEVRWPVYALVAWKILGDMGIQIFKVQSRLFAVTVTCNLKVTYGLAIPAPIGIAHNHSILAAIIMTINDHISQSQSKHC